MEQQTKQLLSEYYIDAADRLIFVDETWREFARDIAAPELVSDSILYKPLWDFIADKRVQHLYQILLARVRQSGEPAQVSYRCDSPGTRRFLQMRMTPDTEAGVHFHNWLVREEKREPVRLLEMTPKRSEEIIIICSWCKLVKLDDDTWVEVENAVQQLGLFEAVEMPKLSHGMCPDCAQTWLATD
jgi:hypothetical protein